MNTYRAGTETLPERTSSNFPIFSLQFLKAHNISLQELHTLPGHKNSLTASLYCLSFFYLRFRIAPLISSNCSCSHIYLNIFFIFIILSIFCFMYRFHIELLFHQYHIYADIYNSNRFNRK